MITKQQLFQAIDDSYDEFMELADILYHHPQLGFKEFANKKTLIDKFKQYGINIDAQYFETGFQVSIGSGYPHIGLLAELDAIIVNNHPLATNEDHCAHACGHSMQCVIMTDAFIQLFKSKITNDLPGTVTLFFTPAEEFVDFEFRQNLIKQGKIKYLSGKQNMLAAHIFDDQDVIIHCHVMGESQYDMNINCPLAGFIYKEFNFIGQEAHAGAAPHLGKNALNMFALFQSAVGMLRETFQESDMVRFHGYVSNGGSTINSIPAKVTYQSYLRCGNYSAMADINEKIETAARSCAAALQGTCEINNINGYLPFIQDRLLSDVIYQNMLSFVDDEKIGKDETSIAGGDVGDICCFKPTIQFGYSGIKGRIHGADFEIIDKQRGYIIPSKVVVGSVYDLLTNPSLVDNIVKNFKPTMTYEQYINYLEQK